MLVMLALDEKNYNFAKETKYALREKLGESEDDEAAAIESDHTVCKWTLGGNHRFVHNALQSVVTSPKS